jgi:hypothetical protein
MCWGSLRSSMAARLTACPHAMPPPRLLLCPPDCLQGFYVLVLVVFQHCLHI